MMNILKDVVYVIIVLVLSAIILLAVVAGLIAAGMGLIILGIILIILRIGWVADKILPDFNRDIIGRSYNDIKK